MPRFPLKAELLRLNLKDRFILSPSAYSIGVIDITDLGMLPNVRHSDIH
jgi:hypothetical protein